ncbi:MAG: hypothetical protein PUC33_01070 [Oscillospiraceae bacterium]|nr:hypothetical protein [Oscillospiraceae bacterium]MDD6147278.1 hypothetical protein [Oscillospiraceae bacterium]
MDEIKTVFDDLEVEEMTLLLENIEEPRDEELSARIKDTVLREIAPEEMQEEMQDGETENGEIEPRKKKGKVYYLSRILPLAAALVIFLGGAAMAVSKMEKPKPQPVATTAAQTTQSNVNPLIAAITAGNDGLIEKLINNTVFATKEVLDFAVECADAISYQSVQDIAKTVYDRFGSTGLDSLLESTLLGNSEKALQELQKRKKMLMTPGEKLAFFFSAAFCDSDVLGEFISKGYDPQTKTAAGKSIYEIAKQYGNEENMQYAAELGVK